MKSNDLDKCKKCADAGFKDDCVFQMIEGPHQIHLTDGPVFDKAGYWGCGGDDASTLWIGFSNDTHDAEVQMKDIVQIISTGDHA